MSWSVPRTWVTGEIVTADLMNSAVRDNLRYLKGLDGVPTIQSGLTIDNTSGDERLLLPLLSTVECATVLNAEGEVAFDEQTHRIKVNASASLEAVVLEADVFNSTASGASHDAISAKWAFDHIASSDPHTGYVLESTLTTSGDMPYANGNSTWTRLPKGTANQRLRMNATASAPEWTSTLLDVTQASVTCAKGTIYQNTTGYPLMITISGFVSTAGGFDVYVASASAPNSLVSQEYGAAGDYQSATFIVPDQYYYVASADTSFTLTQCMRWQIGI